MCKGLRAWIAVRTGSSTVVFLNKFEDLRGVRRADPRQEGLPSVSFDELDKPIKLSLVVRVFCMKEVMCLRVAGMSAVEEFKGREVGHFARAAFGVVLLQCLLDHVMYNVIRSRHIAKSNFILE